MSASQDTRLRSVGWRDLLALKWPEKFRELTLSLPWLISAFVSFYFALYLLGLISCFFFFLTGLRQVHNAFHYAMGLPRWACECVMFVLSILMVSSMHAIQVNHMRHHRHCLADDDIEAATAKLTWWRAILYGPLHPIRLHYGGWIHARSAQRRWIAAEIIAITITVPLIVMVFQIQALTYFVLAMAIGQCFTGFFAVWTVHHDCHKDNIIARTQRGFFKNFVSYNMFFHLEHHLFPSVPTCHLPELAERLDRIAPEYREHQVY